MYSLISHRGIYNEAIKKYIVDEESDIKDVPTDAPAGSECFVIGNSVTYMLNHKKQWIKVNVPSGSSGGSGGGGNSGSGDDSSGDSEKDEVIYEGGDLGGGDDNQEPDDENIYEGGDL